ncbi:hypothetical protein [Methylocapsa acidiphila]|uniref:hypothetical protein n=1 Tax=Methylocapsa acidiphila TaxID=133552 RepID=UPI00040FBEC4|nr:hypothetical protein [Methylocapsa acidiphila]
MRVLAYGFCLILSTAPAMAQVRSVELHKPRLFGYFIGDLIANEVVVLVDAGTVLKTSSLPAPGPLNYWLTLKAIQTVSEPAADGAVRYRLKLTYQTFYDPLEPHWLKIPGFQLLFDTAEQTIAATAPEWSFLSSPIREVAPKESKDNTFLQPDIAAYEEDLARTRAGAFVAGFAAVASYLALAFGHAWPPFHSRPARPFTNAARRLKTLAKKAPREDVYRKALSLLHLAFNKTGERVVLADDLNSFLSAHPQFQSCRVEIAAFFDASRRLFFESDRRAASAFSLHDAVGLCQKLSAVERGLR